MPEQLSVFQLATAALSLIPLALFLHYLKAVLYSPSELRQRERDFDPDTIQGWHLRGPR